MASLRRIASFDKSEPYPSLHPLHCVHRLTRHSSLPNLSLGQPELFGLWPPRDHSHSTSSSNSRTLSRSHPKLSLCRALSTNSSDDLSRFEVPATAEALGRFVLHPSVSAAFDSCGFGESSARSMEAAKLRGARTSKRTVDAEESIVYNELKKSLWKFEAPSRSLGPISAQGRGACAGITAHIHSHIHLPSEVSTGRQDARRDCSRSDVKGRPLSLQMLKRKSANVCNSTPSRPSFRRQLSQSRLPQGAVVPNHFMDASDSMASAFTSLLYIMEMLQQYTHSLFLRSRPQCRSSHENLGPGRACTEMVESFLWLFQQVFSCTPRFMLLTMVLLADFSLHSMSKHVAFPVMALGESPASAYSPSQRRRSEVEDPVAHHILHPRSEETYRLLFMASTTAEGRSFHAALAGEGGRGPAHTIEVETRQGSLNSEDPRSQQPKESIDQSRGRIKRVSEFLSSREKVDLDGRTKRLLVAPVQAPTLEADDYPCFDQTDLAYQREISSDPTNPLLLANYAQFLHLVRHDHHRAEELFKEAVRVEKDVDGELMGKFASFLWVAKGDVAEADRAFKAAAMADPSNAFHAGNYAHFLWNSSRGN